jgi:cardiolipin synthase (CMP-forming)
LQLLPHLLSATRLVAAPLIVWLLIERRFREALAVVLIAGVTDWLDGFAARRLGVSGKFGVVLDPLADKVMLVAVFLTLGFIHLIPFWMLVLVIVRDLVIVVGALLLRRYRNIHRFRPLISGKVSTFFQVVLVLMALIYAAYPFAVFYWLAETALVLTAFFTALSGVLYVRKGILMATERWFGD